MRLIYKKPTQNFRIYLWRASALLMIPCLLVSVLATSGFFNPPKVEAAGNGTIRQEINILTSTYTATNATISSAEFVQVDPTQYSGTVSYYFEVVASTTASSTGDIHLRRQGTTTDDAAIALSTVATTAGRYRSSALSLPGSATEYFVFADAGGASKTVTIKSARIIVIQESNPMLATETQVEIGSKVLAQAATTATPLINPKYWKYVAGNWDNSPTFYAEATHKVVNTTVTIIIQEDDGNFGTWTNKATIATSSATTATRSRVSFTPTDGRNYRIVANRAAGTGTRTYDVYNAKIVVDQGGSLPDPIGKLEAQYLVSNQADSNATGLQGYPTLFDSSEWQGISNTYRMAMDSDNNANSAKLVDVSNSNTDVPNAKVAGPSQQTASPTYVQGANTTSGATSGNTQAAAFTSNVIAGNLIVVAVGWQSSTATISSISDTRGNTYTSAVGPTTNTSIPYRIQTYYAVANSSGANTVNISFSTNIVQRRLAIHEYYGVNTFDQAAGANGTTGVPNSGNVTTTRATELVFGWGVNNLGITVPGAGFAGRQTVGSELTEDKNVFSTGTYNAFFPTASSPWLANVATFYNSSSDPSFSFISGNEIDMNVLNTTGTIASTRIIVVANLPTAVVSVSVSDGNVSYGTLAVGSNQTTTSGGLNDTQTATNDGTVAEDFNIKGVDSADWTLAGSTGANQYKHDFCISGSGSPDPCDASPTWTALTTSYQSLGSNVATSATQAFDLRLNMPTSSSSTAQQNVDVTIQAVQH